MSLREIKITRPEDLQVLLTTHEANCCCDACGNVLAAIDFMKTLLDQAQAVTVERCLKAAIKAVVFYYDDAELVDQLEDSIRDALREPDPNFLARERLKAKIEDRRGCGLGCVDLERELAAMKEEE